MRRQERALVWIGGTALLLCTFALAGCSMFQLTNKSIPNAATILDDAVMVQKTQIKDVEFSMTMSVTTDGTAVTGVIKGTVTASPKRELITGNITTAGLQISDESIIDAATHTMYLKINSPILPGTPSGKWTKTNLGSYQNALPVDPSQFSDLSQFKGATLKGAETLDGIPVWHLQSSKTIDGITTHADIYIRQDNKQLYEMIAHESGSLSGTATGSTSGTMTGTVTFKVTGVNTGATISLPPASQVTTPNF